MNRNIIVVFAVILGVALGAVGYKTYLDRQQPDGVRIDVGPNGISVKGK